MPQRRNTQNKKNGKSKSQPNGQLVPRYPVDPHKSVVHKTLSFVPPRMRQTLRYAQEINLVGTSGALASNGIALNGLFDPDTTGGGHQPLGFDQYLAMYERYCVLSTRVTIDCAINGAAVPTLVGITGLPGITTYASATGRIEVGSTAYRVLPALQATPASLTSVFDMAKFFGIDDLSDEPDICGTSTANPATVAGCTIWCRDVLGTSTVNVSFLVLVEYDTLFLKPAPVPQS